MDPNQIKGTEGYEKCVEEFVTATLSINFFDLHKDFLSFFPKSKSIVLDLGAGIGRDASHLFKMGYTVIAVEPLKEFRSKGSSLYSLDKIIWIDDSLPELSELKEYDNRFDFILASGVWHHLNGKEQSISIGRISELLKPNGIFALSLRNGPAGVGTQVFSTDSNRTVELASKFGLLNLLLLENQPSLMKNKKEVTWSRLVFQKSKV
ncbi:class I SAM-dependent methyltransferase [Leptospira sarikeiensis]|uniref:Class I SAM-dependent methyltransferase n=1 Tax=Leptospira sarikeiensis TaxID=2484943 RepID=A0A4R9K8H1_9LEPT|nr:class I SAM-dependent methyltransferase [Leptospira sarikeiensis]TGL62917.1 class I SAM-dependent methyltransferase [Leptospira sarikeiensis]